MDVRGSHRHTRSLLLQSPGHLEWSEEALPNVASSQLLLRTRCTAISIGTELALYTGAAASALPITYPRMTGYESLAEVVECGRSVRGVKPGDRVVGTYGHRTHAVVDASRVIVVPQPIDDEAALLVICACDAAAGVRRADVDSGERVLITGAGAMGLLTLWNLRANDVQAVDIVEPRADRRDLAVALGASTAISLDGAHTEQYEAGFECAGRQEAFALLQRAIRPRGRICVISDARKEPLKLLPEFHEKEATIIGSSDADNYQEYAAWYFQHIPGSQALMKAMFNVQIECDELPTFLAAIADGSQAVPIKAIVRFDRAK